MLYYTIIRICIRAYMSEDPQLGCRDQRRLSDERSGEKSRQLIAVGQHRLYDIGGVKHKTRQLPGAPTLV
jgi:hypothetical protein